VGLARTRNVALRELLSKLQTRYSNAMLLYFQCLDSRSGANYNRQGFSIGAPDFIDEDGIITRVSYIENVLEKI
jgi:hypothetical protein